MKKVYLPDHDTTYQVYSIMKVYDEHGYRMLVPANNKKADPLSPIGLFDFYRKNGIGAELIYMDSNLTLESKRLGNDSNMYWLTFDLDWEYAEVESNTESIYALKKEPML